jgi:hypothetical protein
MVIKGELLAERYLRLAILDQSGCHQAHHRGQGATRHAQVGQRPKVFPSDIATNCPPLHGQV